MAFCISTHEAVCTSANTSLFLAPFFHPAPMALSVDSDGSGDAAVAAPLRGRPAPDGLWLSHFVHSSDADSGPRVLD